MSKKDTLLALKNSGELKDEAKELLSNTIDSGTDYCKYHITDFAIVLDKYGLNYGAEKYNYAEITPPLGEQNLRVPAGTTVGVVQGGENL